MTDVIVRQGLPGNDGEDGLDGSPDTANQVADKAIAADQAKRDELRVAIGAESSTQLNARDADNRDLANATGSLPVAKVNGLGTAATTAIGDYATAAQGAKADAAEVAIAAINALLASDEVSLDTLQEVVDFIEINRADLENLGIGAIAGLQAALDAKSADLIAHAATQHGTTAAEQAEIAKIANKYDASNPAGYQTAAEVQAAIELQNQTGKIMYGFNFGGRDNHIDLPTISAITRTGDYTFSAWVRLLGTPNAGQAVLIEYTAGSTNRQAIRLVSGSGGGRIYYVSYSGSYSAVRTTRGEFNDGNWHHVAVVHDGATDGVAIYVDGYAESQETISAGAISFGKHIGFQDSGSTNSSHTQADTRIYDRKLTQSELLEIARNRLLREPVVSDPVYWLAPEVIEDTSLAAKIGPNAAWANYDRQVYQLIDDKPSIFSSSFALGNSLSEDAAVSQLTPLAFKNINPSQTLAYHFANPNLANTNGSLPWGTGLYRRDYDLLLAQPFPDPTPQSIDDDLNPIKAWMELQPTATVVIYEGFGPSSWANSSTIDNPYAGTFEYSSAYFDEMVRKLRDEYPLRDIRRTRSLEVVKLAADKINDSDSPLASVYSSVVNADDDLYRDGLHINLHHGRFMVHNAVRRSLGLPVNWQGEFADSFQFGKINTEYADWCLEVIDEVY